jgi:hypothetical protein
MIYEDSKAPFNLYQDQGYYKVGDKNFLYKYNALLESSKSGNTVKWNFLDEVFSTMDWTKPSGRTLLENYKIRAQQIRDKYDYLILSYSGGADSTTILEAFLLNNIKIDEIYCDWPLKLTELSGAKISYDTDHDNHYSEYELTILPKLKEIASKYPSIKIHVSDSLSNPEIMDFEESSYFINIPIHMHSIAQHKYIYNYMHRLSQDTNKKVAIIKGVDKPFIHINKNNQIGMVFLDNGIFYKSDMHETMTRNIELFYWSPDFPQLVIDQCHAILNYFRENKDKFRQIEQSMREMKGLGKRSSMYNIITTAITYPNWKFPFQVDKQPFGRPNCYMPIIAPFLNYDFVKYHFERFNYDYSRVSKPNQENLEHPTPLETFYKWYPITNINNL